MKTFNERVSYAVQFIRKGKPSTRKFDGCFEEGDGDKVVAVLVEMADKVGGKLLDNLHTYIAKESINRARAKRELPETLTEEQMMEIGGQLAIDLGLKRDREHKDRFVTAWGSKTALGLYRTIHAIMNVAPQTHLGRNNR